MENFKGFCGLCADGIASALDLIMLCVLAIWTKKIMDLLGVLHSILQT